MPLLLEIAMSSLNRFTNLLIAIKIAINQIIITEWLLLVLSQSIPTKNIGMDCNKNE